MLIACTLDVNNKIFSLAMALVDSKNDDSYEWFLENLRRAYGIRDDLVIVSDRHSSIQRAVLHVFPEAFYGFCVFHLVQNLKTRFHTNVFSSCPKSSHSILGPYTTLSYDQNLYRNPTKAHENVFYSLHPKIFA